MSRRKYTDGIFNYCDRWCERCAFTNCCRLFADEKKLLRRLEQLKDNPEPRPDFWTTFKSPYDEALDRASRAKWLASVRRREKEPVGRRAKAYTKAAIEWLKALPGGPIVDPLRRDAVDVIGWYALFIEVKLLRAMDTDEGDLEPDEDEDPGLRQDHEAFKRGDQLGTMKVALIAMDRSIIAWSRLADAGEPQAAAMVEQLRQLRAVAEAVYPGARSFLRPGLD